MPNKSPDSIKPSTSAGVAPAVRDPHPPTLAPGPGDPALQPKSGNRMHEALAPSLVYRAGDPTRVDLRG
jgi:hypothetical protein